LFQFRAARLSGDAPKGRNGHTPDPDFDGEIEQRLLARAAAHGQSMEAEARDILRAALRLSESKPAPANLYAAMRAIVEPLGGIELEIPPRHSIRETPRFE
jgi:antitoxin FitA